MKGWQTKRLGDVLDIQNGYAFDSKSFSITGNMPLIRIRDLKQGVDTETRYTGSYDARYVVRRGDLLIGMDGEFGCFEWRGNDALLNQRVCRLEGFSSNLLPRFLFYGVNSHLKAIEEITGYTTVKHLSSKQILDINFLLPPLSEQERIVGILDQAFDGIATAKANAEKNLRNARGIFESHLDAVFSQRGEGWVEGKIGEICTLKSGTTVDPGLERPTGDFPYLKVADMSYPGNETYIVGSSRYLNGCDIGRNAVFPEGTTIFPKRGGAILTNKKRLTTIPICTDLNIMGVIPGQHLVPRLIFYYFIGLDLRRIGSGSSIPQINNYDIEPLIIHYPRDKALQESLISRLDSIRDETRHLEAVYQKKLAALDDLKKSLLDQAFTGNL